MSSIVIGDDYYFDNLVDWERFYQAHKVAIHNKDTRWLNHHIHIQDGGKKYKIHIIKKRLYLKPQIQVDVQKEQESAQLHSLNLVLNKLDELFNVLYDIRKSAGIEQGSIQQSIPHKSVIERVKTIKPDTHDTTEE